ncbi:MAG: hypothetical protein PHO15_08800 [Eubacteriales bacterium]|nr:hypothetical protein [Eubacteriales bacterium]
MFFGKREKEIDMGGFSSSKCRICKKGYRYKFVKTTTYLVVFFINLIPLSSKYESICDECGTIEPVNLKAGRKTARSEFARKNAKQNILTFLKITVFISVLAAAVILPLVLVKAPKPGPQFYKDLVSEDGLYNILDSEGNILATVAVEDGVKILSFYDATSVLVGEDGADGTFIKHEYYYEVSDNETGELRLERIADEPGILEDKYHTVIREYHYDAANDALGYARGIEDLSTIEYTSNKVTYGYIYYLSETDYENYIDVLYLENGTQLRATFIPLLPGGECNRIISFSVEIIENGRTVDQTIYEFDDDTIELAYSAGISAKSSADDILDFVENNTPNAVTLTCAYYKNTKVVTSISASQYGSTDAAETQRFDVTEKNGYYIQRAAE